MSFDLNAEKNVLRITLSGAFSTGELLALIEAVQAHDQHAPAAAHRLTDVSGASGPSITFNDILLAVQKYKNQKLPNAIKSAVVAPGPVQYGFARMYQTLSNHPQVTVQVFRDEPSAQAWLADESVN